MMGTEREVKSGDVSKLAEEILAYIQKYGSVTFAHLATEWPDDFERGDFRIAAGQTGLVLWNNTSERAARAFALLKPQLEIDPCPPWIYVVEGIAPNLPLARGARRYVKPHWVPVVLSMKTTADSDGEANDRVTPSNGEQLQ